MDAVFLGNEQMTIDQKGRVGIPARFVSVLRAIEGDGFGSVGVMMTPDRSIKMMPSSYFRGEVERWRRLDDRIAEERIILNLATSLAELIALDKQNRIGLNPMMMELAGIDRQVIIVGTIKFMQLFDSGVWREMFERNLGRWGEAAADVARRAAAPPPVQYIINPLRDAGG